MNVWLGQDFLHGKLMQTIRPTIAESLAKCKFSEAFDYPPKYKSLDMCCDTDTPCVSSDSISECSMQENKCKL